MAEILTVASSESVLQNDLQEFCKILGLPDTARAESPHQIFQDCLAVLKMRTNYKEPVSLEDRVSRLEKTVDHLCPDKSDDI